MSHSLQFLKESQLLAECIDPFKVEELADILSDFKGKLFILGLGGSSANASHAVNDFRKLCGIEAYCPSDNVAELTAIANDEGWENIYGHWLLESNLNDQDAILILSVGGGTPTVSLPLNNALGAAKLTGAKILGIVGRDGGETKRMGDCVIVIPTVNDKRVTPHVESFQSVILHCLVSHPKLQKKATKW